MVGRALKTNDGKLWPSLTRTFEFLLYSQLGRICIFIYWCARDFMEKVKHEKHAGVGLSRSSPLSLYFPGTELDIEREKRKFFPLKFCGANVSLRTFVFSLITSFLTLFHYFDDFDMIFSFCFLSPRAWTRASNCDDYEIFFLFCPYKFNWRNKNERKNRVLQNERGVWDTKRKIHQMLHSENVCTGGKKDWENRNKPRIDFLWSVWCCTCSCSQGKFCVRYYFTFLSRLCLCK